MDRESRCLRRRSRPETDCALLVALSHGPRRDALGACAPLCSGMVIRRALEMNPSSMNGKGHWPFFFSVE